MKPERSGRKKTKQLKVYLEEKLWQRFAAACEGLRPRVNHTDVVTMLLEDWIVQQERRVPRPQEKSGERPFSARVVMPHELQDRLLSAMKTNPEVLEDVNKLLRRYGGR